MMPLAPRLLKEEGLRCRSHCRVSGSAQAIQQLIGKNARLRRGQFQFAWIQAVSQTGVPLPAL